MNHVEAACDIYHNFALMVEAGVPIKRSLQTAARQNTPRKYVKAFAGLADGIAKGTYHHGSDVGLPESI